MKYFTISILLVSIVFIIIYVSGGNDKADAFTAQIEAKETKENAEQLTPENLIDDADIQSIKNQNDSFVFDGSSTLDVSEQLQIQIKTKAL